MCAPLYMTYVHSEGGGGRSTRLSSGRVNANTNVVTALQADVSGKSHLATFEAVQLRSYVQVEVQLSRPRVSSQTLCATIPAC